ncbi:hypothetical protein MR475_00025, partial [bacterium]|nr:hypothetical protein [bacterium]
RALVASLLAHNFPQNFPVGVPIVGAGPPMVTNFNFFDSLKCPLRRTFIQTKILDFVSKAVRSWLLG